MKMSAKYQPFYLSLNMLTIRKLVVYPLFGIEEACYKDPDFPPLLLIMVNFLAQKLTCITH